ncbi:NUDIX hydrolase domain-like protein, partial [Chytriomyces sp. MP71]
GSKMFTISVGVADFNIPRSAFLAAHPDVDVLASGALIFLHGRVLVMQRAATDSRPLKWETPGGGVDAEDPTILHGVVREVFEEAGLRVVSVDAVVGPKEGHRFVSSRGLKVRKVSFLVTVADASCVILDPLEHAQCLWLTEEDVRAGVHGDVRLEFTSSEQVDVILEGFQSLESGNTT